MSQSGFSWPMVIHFLWGRGHAGAWMSSTARTLTSAMVRGLTGSGEWSWNVVLYLTGNCLLVFVTDHFISPCRALDGVCAYAQAIAFKWNDLWPRYVTARSQLLGGDCLITLKMSRSGSRSKFRVTGWGSSSSTDHIVNMYTAHGLWQITLNCDGNLLWLDSCVHGHHRKMLY